MHKQIQDAKGFGNSFSVNHFLSQKVSVKGRWGCELRGAGVEEVVLSLRYSELMQMSSRSWVCGNRTIYENKDFAATLLMMRGRSSPGVICQRSNRGNANPTIRGFISLIHAISPLHSASSPFIFMINWTWTLLSLTFLHLTDDSLRFYHSSDILLNPVSLGGWSGDYRSNQWLLNHPLHYIHINNKYQEVDIYNHIASLGRREAINVGTIEIQIHSEISHR